MEQGKQISSKIVSFYLGQGRDAAGRTIQQIWDWDFEELERTHDYIQWLFPLTERSAHNPDAPLVNAEVIQAFQHQSQLRQNLLRSLTIMLRFYGLQRQLTHDGKGLITQSVDFSIRKSEWVRRYNHNYLRITRILKGLTTLGCEDEAQAFYACLQQIYQENRDQIGGETFQYWTNAVKSSH